MPNAKHQSQTDEHGTPPQIVEPARVALGEIDLDPASSGVFNAVVRARDYFADQHNGYARPWHGRVFLNPPGGLCDVDGRRVIRAQPATKRREAVPSCQVTGACGLPPGHKHVGVQSSSKAWWFRLAEQWRAGAVEAAVFLAYSLELLQTTQNGLVDRGSDALIPLDFPCCYPADRIKFLGLDLLPQPNPPNAGAIVYLPGRRWSDHQQFRRAYRSIGQVVIPATCPLSRQELARRLAA